MKHEIHRHKISSLQCLLTTSEQTKQSSVQSAVAFYTFCLFVRLFDVLLIIVYFHATCRVLFYYIFGQIAAHCKKLLPWAPEGFFRGGALGNFSQIFSGGGQKWWNLSFSHSKLKKLFLLKISKSRGEPWPALPPLPAPMIVIRPSFRVVFTLHCSSPGVPDVYPLNISIDEHAPLKLLMIKRLSDTKAQSAEFLMGILDFRTVKVDSVFM